MDVRGYEMQAVEAQDRLAELRGLMRDLTVVLEKRNAKIKQLCDLLILLSQWMDETVMLGRIASDDYTKSLRKKISALLQD